MSSRTRCFTTVVAAAATLFLGTSAAHAKFFDDFGSFTAPAGNFNGGQFESGLAVAFSGSLPGWDKSGGGTVHAVDTANVFANGIVNPRDFAVMIWQNNVITQQAAIAGSNDAGVVYEVSFDVSPAVYQASSQVTTESDGLLIEVLRGDGSVLDSYVHQPGAWASKILLVADSFEYTGDGSGDVRLRIGPSAFNSGHFGGAIDNLAVSVPNPLAPAITSFGANPATLADAGDPVIFGWQVDVPLDSLVLTPGDIDVLGDTDGSGEGSFTLDPGPDGTTTYTLTATRGEFSGTRMVTVTLPAPRIISFAASPVPAAPGEALTLTWKVGLPVSALTITPGDIDVLGNTDALGVGSITFDAGLAESTVFTLTAARGTSTRTAQAAVRIAARPPNAIFFEDFNNYTAPAGNFNGGQFESGLAVAHAGNLPGWAKAGGGTVHAVDTANVFADGIVNPREFAVMIWQNNVITQQSAIPGSNSAGVPYEVAFQASPAVYQAGVQQTVTDGLLIEVLRSDDSVLATYTHEPGAWDGNVVLVPDRFVYIGDGSGDIRLRIGPSAFNSGHFGGAIDDLAVSPVATGLFQITDITLDKQTGAAIITFASFDGAIYAVEASSDLDSWDELDDSVIGTGESTSFTDSFFAPGSPLRTFYRVRRQ